LNPEYIYVTGAVSVIGQISSVGVEVNVEGVNSDMDGSAAIRLYDANNNELSLGDKVELNLEEVDYHVTILKVKSLALDFQVGGTVADGYRFTGVECNLKTVSVEGLKSTLASISTLTIPKEVLTVEGAKGDRQVEVDLASLLPDNITIANGTETKALVTLKVEALVVREVEYDLQDAELVGEREEYSYSFDQDQTVLQIRGLEEDLDMIQTEDIKLRIDVEDLESGVYPAVIDVDLSQGFELVGCGSLTITVEEPEEETVEEEEE
jgi:YbbR domain-containing protein